MCRGRSSLSHSRPSASALILALTPRAWLSAAFGSRARERPIHVLALWSVVIVALVAYVVTLIAYFAPPASRASANVAYSMCPACVLSITVDPSPSAVLLILGPLDATLYGSLGAVSCCAVLALRKVFKR